jgi:UDP-glucose 4-epimerase
MNGKPSILLTGATGFIGHHLVRSALEKGYHVHALVRETSQVDDLRTSGITFHYADITKFESIKTVFNQLAKLKVNLDYVIHAAALTKARSEPEFLLVNCGGTQYILSALEHTGLRVRKFIFISSLAACGPELLGKVIDKSRSRPITLYGKSKLLAESIVKRSEWPYIILRPTAVYGPGEKDLFTVFKIVSRRLNPMLGFNKQELTFIYVKDLVEMILASLTSPEENKTYFITDGVVYPKSALGNAIATALNKTSLSLTLPLGLVKTMAMLAQYAASLVKKQSTLNLEKYKELTAQSWNCDVTETFKALAYTPRYNLQEGVKETTLWYQKNKWI